MSENANEKMPTRGIRMPDELWNTCIEMSKELGYGFPSDFIRDAIEFFIEWNNRKSSEKFLTPALESVMRGIVQDSDDRMGCLLYKLAVSLDMMARLLYHATATPQKLTPLFHSLPPILYIMCRISISSYSKAPWGLSV